MSSKRHRGEGSRARPRFDSSRFVSEATEARFHKVIDRKTLVLERGLKPNANLDGDMALMIAERNWFQLVEQPRPAVIAIVKEFYANAVAHEERVVLVRGKPVSFAATNINEYFGLTAPMAARYEDRLPDSDKLIRQLCKPGTQWATKAGTDIKISFPHSALSKYGKAWYAFLCARLMPTPHQNDVTKERARLLYGICDHWLGMHNEIEFLAVDVGLCIQESIDRVLRGGTTGGLVHGFLITDLCRRAGVQWNESEPVRQPMAIIDHATIDKYKAWDGAVSHPRGMGYIVHRPPSPQLEERPVAGAPESSSRFQRKLERQNLRLAERQSKMYTYTVGAFTALADAFSQFSPNTDPVQLPIPDGLPHFPPLDDEELDDEEYSSVDDKDEAGDSGED